MQNPDQRPANHLDVQILSVQFKLVESLIANVVSDVFDDEQDGGTVTQIQMFKTPNTFQRNFTSITRLGRRSSRPSDTEMAY